jgi:hypothetical protein
MNSAMAAMAVMAGTSNTTDKRPSRRIRWRKAMTMRDKRRLCFAMAKICAVLLTIGLGSLAFSHFTGRSACVIINITGIPCPSCGMTRAWISFFGGHIGEAFFWHPMFLIVAAIPFVPLFEKWGIPEKVLLRFCIGVVALMIVLWLYRLVALFPDTAPMRFYDEGLIPQIVRTIRSVLAGK